MKIAIPNNGDLVNQHFGMSKSFAIVSVEENKILNVEEVSAEELSHQHQGLANLLVNEGASVVIVGGIGGGAVASLQQNGLKVIKGATGEYIKVVEEYLKGTLEDKDVTCNHHGEHHHGGHHH
ncbi:NifB/NifX family molybdenum-iron cluster-binding protein [Clostridium sp. 'White wine YQ']|uniref:NifB/NifX family molybdenum-iron cluster-binding protein n=1 Tax=Clostridium sp. 'White wine YQ' TaxID=3027474 RepID=UPI002366F74E|nr:NifB/NifX family molybdenum-iron cluster-binding protein [Clostridium sp. 'White wine YQ']MDD7793513.1 NifB/NifX family molybdenum-iron cluster-binding protein [Clostridium sp. 'White wine YQ']